jgi:hypothetical protein
VGLSNSTSGKDQGRGTEGIIAMDTPFKIYGPFEISNKLKVTDKEYQKEFWSECVEKDDEHYKLSEAKGLYLFSLRHDPNFTPWYVGMTERDFKTEVFTDRNMLMIRDRLVEEHGVLCLHLLAKPKQQQRGFSQNISGRELYWIEDFIQQMCRIRNPDFFNLSKSKFLLKAAIEGITDGTANPGIPPERIRTFRKAIGFDD